MSVKFGSTPPPLSFTEKSGLADIFTKIVYFYNNFWMLIKVVLNINIMIKHNFTIK